MPIVQVHSCNFPGEASERGGEGHEQNGGYKMCAAMLPSDNECVRTGLALQPRGDDKSCTAR